MSQKEPDTFPAEDEAVAVLADYAERAYLSYAVSVVKGRALPELADGQKPVQRRILYAMQQMGLDDRAKPVKSARVVGDVLGKFHPHGDQSAYDALVRLAQDFSLRYPLIDGQGNFGSRDGDGAAAMRYTEAKLTPIARLLLDELALGTVDLVPNYDGSGHEPKLLPARLPFVLLNGASGIAVGMATEIPSHNLTEVALATVALIRDPQLTLSALMAYLPAPDFPGGGQIISARQDIEQVYASGRGSVKVRARWLIEDLARGQWQLVVTELPPHTSAQRVLEEIEELTNPKVKAGKKALTPEQSQTKQAVLSVLDVVRDESGKDAAVRLVFEPKSKHVDKQAFAMMLLAHTSLEANVSINLVMVGNDGRPQQKNLLTILQEWIAFRLQTVTRRSQYRLTKVAERIHILEGRILVLLNIDQVIEIIRHSDEPKLALMHTFKLSERQAEDILEIRLRQLARLEALKIEQELADLQDEKKSLEALLASDSALKKRIIKEIEADAKQFGDPRRTLIQAEQKAVIEIKLVDEPVTVIVSQNGWIRLRPGHNHDLTQLSFKPGDRFQAAFSCRSVDTLVMLDSMGRAYSTAVAGLPSGRGDGVPMTSLIDLQEQARIMHACAGPAEQSVLVATESGYGFICKLSDLMVRNRSGKAFVTLAEHDVPLALIPLDGYAKQIACLSEQNRLLVFNLDEIKCQAGGRGVILIDLDQGDSLVQVRLFGEAGLNIQYQGRALKPIFSTLAQQDLEIYTSKRARKGKIIDKKWKSLLLMAS